MENPNTNSPHKPKLPSTADQPPVKIPNNELADKPHTFRNIFVLILVTLFILSSFFLGLYLRDYLL